MEVKFIVAEKSEINEVEQSVIGWGSKPTPDRDKELIESGAWKLDTFKSNPVLMLSHDYSSPPIGKVLWVKADENGLKFKARFANSERGREIYELYKDGIMNAFSVGFSPKAVDTQPDKDIKYKGMNLKKVFKEVDLLEISCVSIPANSQALVEYVKSGKIRTKILKEEFDNIIEIIESKSVDEKIDNDFEIEDSNETTDNGKAGTTEEVKDEILNEINEEEIEDIKAVVEDDVVEKEVDEEIIDDEVDEIIEDDLEEKEYSDWTETDDEGVYLVKDAEDFNVDTLRVVTLKKYPPCIKAMMGESLEDAKIEIQSLLFPKEDWTQEEAEDWLSENSIKSFNIAFETLSEDISDVLLDFKESIMEEVKGMANDNKVEIKRLDVSEMPAVSDITSAIRNKLDPNYNKPISDGPISNQITPISYIYLMDLYPINYPDGYCVVGKFENTSAEVTNYFRYAYTYDIGLKTVSFGDSEAVDEGWVLKQYDGTTKITLGEIKTFEKEVKKEIEEVEDEIEIEIEEKSIKQEFEDIEIEEEDGLVEVDSDSLQKAITDVFLTFKKEDIIKNSSIKEIAKDAINKARGKVIVK